MHCHFNVYECVGILYFLHSTNPLFFTDEVEMQFSKLLIASPLEILNQVKDYKQIQYILTTLLFLLYL